ncbi:HAD-IA family hydrolase [Actinokineospora globicatena]|uniref:Haloacid dehalogenase n=1 Tax=Actinokineospora globicatena TaxID=103729 RepID=A0A9W6VDT5_9PSEU|nr:HAD-IA family hydrolase [Actinokineospora globicatena]MCP2302125.1 haloacid dehalogenase superfamily, subfamily IA, variant 3 with third motif having DD or ED [Actinokineospora globicatena]GLW76213.1 haloacid dehalogenase [Actinokineospora globicatena]GLW83049.1 haloacid dehalogenase [Actinokineospora globicatena]GLW95328.1 haloacid dehalogenase [Actinokineospora globicatena]
MDALVVDYAGVFTEDGMPEVVARVRAAGFKTALLSNADAVPAPLPDVFDAVVVSGAVGFAKPDAAIYRHAAAVLRVDPSRCVFVDDVAEYVRGAARVGMVGVHHRDVESTVEELVVLLDLPAAADQFEAQDGGGGRDVE